MCIRDRLIDKLIEEDYTSIDIAVALLNILIGKQREEDALQEDKFEKGEGVGAEMVRFFINVGRQQKIRPRDIVGAIAGEAKIPGDLIGAIDIHDRFSFVEVPKEHARRVLLAMKKSNIKGKSISIEKARRRR